MQKISIYILTLIVIVLAIWVMILMIGKPIDSPPPPPGNERRTEIEKKPVKPEEVERVKSRQLKGQFTASGRGEDSNWGWRQVANFQYTASMVVNSIIESSEVLAGGKVKLVEIRTFECVTDSLCISDVDVNFDIKTLPVDEFSTIIDAGLAIYASLSGNVGTASVIFQGKEYVKQFLEDMDGTSMRNFYGTENVPQNIEEELQRLGQAKFRKMIGGIRVISGKSYRITWYQDSASQPMYVKFTYANGDTITSEEELMVLKRANAFIDSKIAPNPKCHPGESWTIRAEEMQEVFDPYVDGIYSGILTVQRNENDDNGNWVLELAPANINICGESGSQNGSVTVVSGSAKILPKDVSLLELYIEGTCDLRKVSKHHLLFTATVDGKCAFQGRLITLPTEETAEGANED